MKHTSAISITLASVGYTVALTLLIISAVNGDVHNLYLLFPLFFTPAMVLLIRPDSGDKDFCSLFAIFMITFGIVTFIALPLTLWSSDKYKDSTDGSGYGLAFALGSVGGLFTFVTGAIVVKVKGDSNDGW